MHFVTKHVSTNPESSGGMLYNSQHWHCTWWCEDAPSSCCTVFVPILMPVEVWNSSALESAKSCQLFCTTCISTRWPCSVTLRSLLHYDWVAAVPNPSHFQITPLTKTDLLQRRHLITSTMLEFPALWPILCLQMQTECFGAWFYTPVTMCLIETLEYNN